MSKKTISYASTGFFSPLICDYLEESEALQSFYGSFPKLENFKGQIVEKNASFSEQTRQGLVQQLQHQYANVDASEATQTNIASLAEPTTFTITTGHQLNLFTGPLYFLYKIFSVINLSEELNRLHPENHFVPVYWMASEDHDFDEINYFNFKGEKIRWNREDGGAVGDLDTSGMDVVAQMVREKFGASAQGKQLSTLFTEAYHEHDNLADATRYLANTLFREHGLVIVDGNDAALKKCFAPYVKEEIENQRSHKKITETSNRLTALGYPEQVHPREINLFYLKNRLRERIVERDGMFYINDTDIAFSKPELLQEVENHPERFSPNALLRPLYQEIILPNLCYVGGGGELAYWFQLKDYFQSVKVPFPMLLLRNSVLLVPQKVADKLNKLEVTIPQLFQKQSDLRTEYTKQISEIEIDFSTQREHLKLQFAALYEVAKQTDASFVGAVAAQEKKQLNGLDHLEKRLLKAQKRKLADHLDRLTNLQDQLFPKQSLQERTVNFSEFYLEYGDQLMSILKEQLAPLENKFTVITLP
ncbi:MAG: bacillithiol biosynthesis cysteine-adding enzyme BshC [Marinirhabdus sp.]|nr:bacillithiol biosynthesis cysteine-adding enzyme BshC [Marinirhabdus sp.]